jgi:hypothetical protein
LELQRAWESTFLHVTTALAGLESLVVYGECSSFLERLPPMPRLTKLEAVGAEPPIESPISGEILTRFPKLKDLFLDCILDEEQWQEDVRSTALLTDLRVLPIYFSGLGLHGTAAVSLLWPLTSLKQLRELSISPLSAPDADIKECCTYRRRIMHEMGFPVSFLLV